MVIITVIVVLIVLVVLRKVRTQFHSDSFITLGHGLSVEALDVQGSASEHRLWNVRGGQRHQAKLVCKSRLGRCVWTGKSYNIDTYTWSRTFLGNSTYYPQWPLL